MSTPQVAAHTRPYLLVRALPSLGYFVVSILTIRYDLHGWDTVGTAIRHPRRREPRADTVISALSLMASRVAISRWAFGGPAAALRRLSTPGTAPAIHAGKWDGRRSKTLRAGDAETARAALPPLCLLSPHLTLHAQCNPPTYIVSVLQLEKDRLFALTWLSIAAIPSTAFHISSS